MKNIEFYRNELANCEIPFGIINFVRHVSGKNIGIYENTYSSLVDWLLEEHQILDDVEKRYLKNIIRPFREQVGSIVKGRSGNREFIIIHYIEDGYTHYIFFPSFKKGTMYTGMEQWKSYTPEELGL